MFSLELQGFSKLPIERDRYEDRHIKIESYEDRYMLIESAAEII